jgi:hypothetical protein
VYCFNNDQSHINFQLIKKYVVYSLNTIKYNCLIKILVTGSLVLYSFRQYVSVDKRPSSDLQRTKNATCDVSHVAFLVHCTPDDGRLSTETCCLNEYNTRLPVNKILIKQLCLTVLSEYILPSTMEWKALNM